MNIFAVHPDPTESANQLCDQHVVKMLSETALMLSTALHRHDITTVVEAASSRFCADDHAKYKQYLSRLYKPAYQHHPCTVWAGDDMSHFEWLSRHGFALAQQYRIRYPRLDDTGTIIEHSAYRIIVAAVLLQAVFEVIPDPHDTICVQPASFPQCMPDEYKGQDPHLAYRRYYAGEKTFARYRYTMPPNWMPATSIQP